MTENFPSMGYWQLQVSMEGNTNLIFSLVITWVSFFSVLIISLRSYLKFQVPPPELVGSIFPWIEEEQTALKERIARLGKVAKDEALMYFLALLKHLRMVLLQDAAVLSSKYPGIPLFQFLPLNSEAFKTFSASSAQIIEIAESEARENLKNLPQQYATSIQGFMKTALLKQESHESL